MEKCVKMASNRGTKGGRMKSPKKEDDDDDFLEDLVVDTKPKKTTFSNLKPGGFITKAQDHKGRLDKRHLRIAAAREQDDDDDDDDDDDETEKEQLERETRQLQSELRKTEKSSRKG